MSDPLFQAVRTIETILFAAEAPVPTARLREALPEGADLEAALERLAKDYADRGVTLRHADGRWAFRTAPDMGHVLRLGRTAPRKPGRAVMETLAIIAWHQPVTRGDIESLRGVALSRGTLDSLLEAGWIQPRGRRRAPGRPMTWGTTSAFLDHFGLESLDDLPRIDELADDGPPPEPPGGPADD